MSAEMLSLNLNLFPLDSRVARTHGRTEGREVSRDTREGGVQREQATVMERGQERLGLKSVCCCVVNGNLGKVSVSAGGVCFL